MAKFKEAYLSIERTTKIAEELNIKSQEYRQEYKDAFLKVLKLTKEVNVLYPEDNHRICYNLEDGDCFIGCMKRLFMDKEENIFLEMLDGDSVHIDYIHVECLENITHIIGITLDESLFK